VILASWLAIIPVIANAAVKVADAIGRLVSGKAKHAEPPDDYDAPPVTALSHKDVEHQQSQIRTATTQPAPPPSPRRQPLRPPPRKPPISR